MPATLRIEIFPADLDRTIEFYGRLGFDLIGRRDGPPRYASLRLDQVRIGVMEAEPVEPSRRAFPVMSEIVIDVDDIELFREQVGDAGIVPSEELREREWGLTDFRVTDPDGYYLRFTSRRN